ncbi:Histone-lysine N-methyltransferase set9 [Toensbergia leucococca]|nr:Histone-lysine N-methyltransferase set9 [Toensbergia leucococca]
MPQDVATKKERLTLSQLASYDDILTDALVDHVYFWTTIRKNRSKYNLTRGISEDDVTSILLHDVVVNKDPQKAEVSLLKLAGLRKFMEKLKTEREKEDFKRHMRKYINIWLPDCPFEVSTTNRYTIITQEASTTARRSIKKGDLVKYLSGNLVAMTSEEEKDLDLTRRDFSIVMSSRKKTPSLFLGPARFANHDCEANARLVTRGSEGMQVVAVRDIEVNEEITVTYGDNYFGEGNCECLCNSCENKRMNGWAGQDENETPSGTITPMVESEREAGTPYSFRRTRKYVAHSDLRSVSRTPENDEIQPSKKRKIKAARTRSSLGLETVDMQIQGSILKAEKLGSALRHEISRTGLDTSSSYGKLQEEYELRDSVETASATLSDLDRGFTSIDSESHFTDMNRTSFRIESVYSKEPAMPLDEPAHISHLTTYKTPTTPLGHSIPSLITGPQHLQPSNASSDIESIFDTRNPRSSSPTTTPSASQETGFDWRSQRKLSEYPSSDSDLSSLSSNEDFDDTHHTIIRKPPQKKSKRPSHLPQTLPTPDPETPSARYPGDYIRTSLLLGEKYSRWVDCRTCDACWVQSNGYYTRKECPRCERHSKLYGFRWPQTERRKGDDGEERVMDHRTVHRFLGPEEEARVRKRGRGLEREGVSERGGSEGSVGVEVAEWGKRRGRSAYSGV